MQFVFKRRRRIFLCDFKHVSFPFNSTKNPKGFFASFASDEATPLLYFAVRKTVLNLQLNYVQKAGWKNLHSWQIQIDGRSDAFVRALSVLKFDGGKKVSYQNCSMKCIGGKW